MTAEIQFDLDLRPGLHEGVNGWPQQTLADWAPDTVEPNPTAHGVTLFTHQRHDLRHVAQRTTTLRVEKMTTLGEPQRASGTLHQSNAQQLLQRGDLLGHL
ncbi:hypothetical protein [Cobetia sp. ICG0124]|uniref:hypothetical protein n=1 Tax=Cobetia sp. ICG0124 TaxID=2053669 RepID=UPI00196A87C4|nr:hypothetical protein [Cobetia sp. ICG0124]